MPVLHQRKGANKNGRGIRVEILLFGVFSRVSTMPVHLQVSLFCMSIFPAQTGPGSFLKRRTLSFGVRDLLGNELFFNKVRDVGVLDVLKKSLFDCVEKVVCLLLCFVLCMDVEHLDVEHEGLERVACLREVGDTFREFEVFLDGMQD